MHNSKPIDTSIEKGYTVSLEDCPKSKKGKESNGKSSLCKCSWKSNVCYVVYLTRHLFCSWYG